jgi:hypothetical protein
MIDRLERCFFCGDDAVRGLQASAAASRRCDTVRRNAYAMANTDRD